MSDKKRISYVCAMHYLIHVVLHSFIALFCCVFHAQPYIIVCFDRFAHTPHQNTPRGILLCGVYE